MSASIPRAVLSEHVEQVLRGRRVASLVFTTFKFDPGFLEQEVLPVFLDIPLSPAPALRLVQLEDALRTVEGGASVYFDVNGLVSSDAGSARLDVRRIPVRHPTGIFHPKNILAIVEEVEPDEEGRRARSLLVGTMSANLTRSGWWENVEVCHFEEIAEGAPTRLKDDLVRYLRFLRDRTPAEQQAVPVEGMLSLLRGTEQRAQKSVGGRLHPHFYFHDGKQTVPDFLEEVAGELIRGAHLDVISPYFDKADESAPLNELLGRFEPRETRVFLPRSAAGEALCDARLFESIRALDGTSWGTLGDKDLLRLGKGEDAGSRSVHAKVYRFFTQNPKREILFIGSVNLTSPAHGRGGNVETGFLVDLIPERRPESWLSVDNRPPTEFVIETEDEGAASSGGTPLLLRYHWNRSLAEAFWNDREASPALTIQARGITVWKGDGLPSREWQSLPSEAAARMAEILPETSFVEVDNGKEVALLLVEEEGMSHKPSLLQRLSATDILRYWALLTPEQRSAFLETRAGELVSLDGADSILRQARLEEAGDTIFDRFAGFFHAFGCMERSLREALTAGNEREADYRLFGKKYDSLGSLLDRVLAADGGIGDPVDRYVILLCAKQLSREIARGYPDYWQAHREDAKELEVQLARVDAIRDGLIAQDPAGMPGFMAWFERSFLERAQVREGEP